MAVASNFTHTLQILAHQFEVKTGHQVSLIVGSTGQHYAQIKNGAPFDAFFAADIDRPALLEFEGLSLPGSRFTYATGKLVLWWPGGENLDDPMDMLQQGDFQYLAVANPRLAPYGKAAQEVLQAHDIWNTLSKKMVRGENIGQAYQFVRSGNAAMGFVAYSQLKSQAEEISGAYWVIPQSLYTPIEQQAVLLRDSASTRAFWDFVQSDTAQRVISDAGYQALAAQIPGSPRGPRRDTFAVSRRPFYPHPPGPGPVGILLGQFKPGIPGAVLPTNRHR